MAESLLAPSRANKSSDRTSGRPLRRPWHLGSEDPTVSRFHCHMTALHGVYSFEDINGYRYEGRYESGLRDGRWNVFRPDGSPAWSTEWYRGVWHGTSTSWWPNGQKSQKGSYQRGHKSGIWGFWFENGQIAALGQYREGRKRGAWSYWSEGGTAMSYDDWIQENSTYDWAYDDERGLPHGENWPAPPSPPLN
jgi:antitoxin component YwqK of YwqJK toxin-antitoxin module